MTYRSLLFLLLIIVYLLGVFERELIIWVLHITIYQIESTTIVDKLL